MYLRMDNFRGNDSNAEVIFVIAFSGSGQNRLTSFIASHSVFFFCPFFLVQNFSVVWLMVMGCFTSLSYFINSFVFGHKNEKGCVAHNAILLYY